MVLYVCEKRYKWSNKDEEWREMWSHVKKKAELIGIWGYVSELKNLSAIL